MESGDPFALNIGKHIWGAATRHLWCTWRLGYDFARSAHM